MKRRQCVAELGSTLTGATPRETAFEFSVLTNGYSDWLGVAAGLVQGQVVE
jgi:hypothetical protein